MATPYIPSAVTQSAILEFTRQAYRTLNQQWQLRQRLESVDRLYMREVDNTVEQAKARLANKLGDPTKFQNIIIPEVLPQVEAAVAYQQAVFLQGYPYFGVVSSPEHIEQALQMDSLMGSHQVRYNWGAHILRTFRDGFKYNLAAMEVDWATETSFALEANPAAESAAELRRTREIVYAGNRLKHLDLYNTFFDTRVKPTELYAFGEFAGYSELYSRIRLKQFLATLPYRNNVTEAFESGDSEPATAVGNDGTESYYIPHINWNALIDLTRVASTDWLSWAGIGIDDGRIKYNNMYQVTTVYGRIIPSDFKIKNVPGLNTPQVWKFIIVNNSVVVYAERMTNIHQYLPIFLMQPYDDGLGYQTKSLADNVSAFQELQTALANSSIAARRRAISDRMLYDPTRVSAASINSDNPSSKIPVKPSSFSQSLAEAVYPIPFRDDQFQINGQEIAMYNGMANRVSGLNQARQGQFVKGNKTRFEFAEIMANATGRDQTVAITIESNFFTPIKEVLKSNILQYAPAGEVYNREQEAMVPVDPVALRQAVLEFKVSDGLLPSDKLIDGESLQEAMQAMAAIPALSQAYNIGPMFSYLMKSRGAKLTPFEKSQEQIAYEEALAAWQGSVAAIAESLKDRTPEEIQAALPPQPLPQDYNYDPNSSNPATAATHNSGSPTPQ